MKSYTDIEQSKKLAKILPLESADMYYFRQIDSDYFPPNVESICPIPLFKDGKEDFNYDIRCWSLASLLGVLPPYLYEFEKGIDFNLYPSVAKKRWWCAGYISQDLSPENKDKFTLITHGNNPVDACVAMIEKLHEQNLL